MGLRAIPVALGLTVALALGACVSSSSGGEGGGTGGGSGAGGTGGQTSCHDVLDCTLSFDALLQSLPACKSCLQASCATEIAGCGPNGASCADSVACFSDPIAADYAVDTGACAGRPPGEAWPLVCYLTREECQAIRQTEPAGLALAQCMMSSCATDCQLAFGNCDQPPPECSTLSP